MRIVVTNSGKYILQDLSEISHHRFNSYDESKYNKSTKDDEEILFENANKKNPNFKSIKVLNHENLDIPFTMSKKYNDKNENYIPKINSVPDLFTSINETIDKETSKKSRNIKLPVIRTSFPIKYIINPYSYKKLENEVKVKKDNLKRVKLTENNFRSEYCEDPVKKFERSVSSEIKIQNKNLIMYLNEDNNITNTFIKQLSHFNDEKLKKLNKICQKVFLFKNKNQNLKNNIKDKLNEDTIKINNSYKNRLKELKKDLEKSKSILSFEYPKYNKKDRYINQYRKAEKDWVRYDTERYFKKSDPPKNSANPKKVIIEMDDD